MKPARAAIALLSLPASAGAFAQEAKLAATRDYLTTAWLLNETAIHRCNIAWLGQAKLSEVYPENGKALAVLPEKFAAAVRESKDIPAVMAQLQHFRTLERQLPVVACADGYTKDEDRLAKLATVKTEFDSSQQDLLTAIEVAEATRAN